MAREPTLPGEGELYPRYLFLERLVPGRRVLEVGAIAATHGHSARFLKERGAARVVSIDPNVAAVRRAHEDPSLKLDGVTLSDLALDALAGQLFDLIFVHGVEPDAMGPPRLQLLRRLLARSGWLVLAARDTRGPSLAERQAQAGDASPALEQLGARLKGAFLSVEVATQTAVFAYAVGPEGQSEPETSLDETLAGVAAPAFRLFICGVEPTGLTASVLAPLPAAVVGAPSAEPAPAIAAADPLGLADELARDFDDLRIDELERRTQSALEQAQGAELLAAQALAERDRLKAELARRAADSDEGPWAERARAAEAARASAEAAHAEVQAALVERDAELGRLAAAVEAAQAQASAMAAERSGLEERLTAMRASLENAEARLREAVDTGQMQEWRLGDELREVQARLAQTLVRWREDVEAAQTRERRVAEQALGPANGHGAAAPSAASSPSPGAQGGVADEPGAVSDAEPGPTEPRLLSAPRS